MHLFAFDEGGRVVPAAQSIKYKNYYCRECRQVVRLRSGLHRQRHFYHLQPNHACRQSGKSLIHLMLQYYVQSRLPPDEVVLEYRMEPIQRIADVAWLSQRIVFEVQCSPITAQEVEERNADYASAGYQTIWLLHDSRYNQTRVSAAENTLQTWPHYFTDMDEAGEGNIYDQLSVFSKGRRRERLPRRAIDLSQPCRISKQAGLDGVSDFFFDRIRNWPVFFRGDSIDAYYNNEYDQDLEALQEKMGLHQPDIWQLPIQRFICLLFNRCIVYPYRAVLRLFLERASF